MALSSIGSNVGQASVLPAAPQVASAAGDTTSPAAVQKAAVLPQDQLSQEQLERTVEAMKQLVESKSPNSLSFSLDDSTGKTVVRVSDARTGEMIRQIPSEELLDIARSLDKLQGMLLRQEA